jgi:hypothetical protein
MRQSSAAMLTWVDADQRHGNGAIRMRVFRLVLLSGLLTGMAAYAQAGAPDWSAFIGSGQAHARSQSCESTRPSSGLTAAPAVLSVPDPG